MPKIWVCTAQPADAALRKAAAAGTLVLEHAVLSLLLARGRLTRAEYDGCAALLGQALT